MHITLYLTSKTHPTIRLPRSNLHLFQGLLYHIMPRETATFLHDGGYSAGSQKLKLFAMSWPESDVRPEFTSDAMILQLPIRLTISTPVTETMSAIVHGAVTAEILRIGNQFLSCNRAEVKQYRADGESVTVRTLSPVTCYRYTERGGRRFTEYLTPDMPDFEDYVHNNLISKFRAFHPDLSVPTAPVCVIPIGDMYERAAMHSRDAKVPIKGWSGRFQLFGPRELLQIAIDCGIGGKNSGGWGCIMPDVDTR